MPLYCSTTGSTALREAEVQQPMIAATLSLTRSFLAFSAKVGQSGAVFLNEFDLAPEHTAHGVDLLDGELFGLDRPGFRNRHRAGGRMKNADCHFGVGDRQPRGVDRGSG